jgi:hypothetical protein
MNELVGTEKQVNWANAIRAEKMRAIDAELEWFYGTGRKQLKDGKISQEQFDATVSTLETAKAKVASQTAATWWIDRRETLPRQILQEMAR